MTDEVRVISGRKFTFSTKTRVLTVELKVDGIPEAIVCEENLIIARHLEDSIFELSEGRDFPELQLSPKIDLSNLTRKEAALYVARLFMIYEALTASDTKLLGRDFHE